MEKIKKVIWLYVFLVCSGFLLEWFSNHIVATDYKKQLEDQYKIRKNNLESEYKSRLDNIETDCPKENIYYFDHHIIRLWYNQYIKEGYITIYRKTFNDPMTHLSVREGKKIDEMLREK